MPITENTPVAKLDLPCPSCGAKISFQSSISLFAVCPYCSSCTMRKDMNLETLGKAAQLQEDGSPMQLGVEGQYKGSSFRTVGRLQMRYEDGLWNEWYLIFDNERSGWLGEAQGLYAMSFQSPARKDLPLRVNLKVGDPINLDGESYEVRDIESAEYISAQGELPFRAPLGEKNGFVDLSGPENQFATLDYSEDPPLLFKGKYVKFDALEMKGLKEFEGW